MLPNTLKSAAIAVLITLGASVSPHSVAGTQMDWPYYAITDAKGSSGKSRAAARAKAAHGGKVLSVTETSQNGQKVYRVKLLLDSGRVKIVTIKGG